ncbi:MAG TPA: 3-dehydro-L-gulonate 2-dehydrogenase [Spirochaetia bacterium]|nr:3-dehydro-L-gulonate 2-dehydrogenase [Spirochaetia bacterium]
MRVAIEKVESMLKGILEGNGFDESGAALSARLFTEASRDGVHSHGLGRFAAYVESVRSGIVSPGARPRPVRRLGALEQWDGAHGPGNINAWLSMARAIELAADHGIGCVALANTNHWMRAGSYGWQAAEAGCVALCWTNTIGNMPPWGGLEPKLGNNPLCIAVPYRDEPIVLDFAQTQYSYGKLELQRRAGQPLPYPGGFDREGRLTTDAGEIIETQRALPIGFWKGSGLSMALDLAAALLSHGDSTFRISKRPAETDVSQVFIALRLPDDTPGDIEWRESVVTEFLEDLHGATPTDSGTIRAPGERVRAARRDAELNGIEVDEGVWRVIEGLRSTAP